MKIKASILSGVVATLFLSVGTERAGITEGFQIGDYAPAIILPEFGGRAIDFREHAGQYTLVNFWAAYDAESRVRNIQLRNSVKELDSSLLAVHSISMDERKSVFEGTLKADGLEKTNQWNDRRGKASALYKMYGLEKGLRNFLIDDKGVIVGVDLSPREVIRIVTGNRVAKAKPITNDRKEEVAPHQPGAGLSPARMRPILVALPAAPHDPHHEWGLFTDASRLRRALVTFVHSVGPSFREWPSHAMFIA